MSAVDESKLSGERRWGPGSWMALSFALFLFTYNLGYSIYSVTLPTDGWVAGASQVDESPILQFKAQFLDGPTPIMPGDRLIAVNGLPYAQILERQHRFYVMQVPGWPDGTRLQYEVLRDGESRTVDVAVSRAPFWRYFTGLLEAQGTTGLVQVSGSLAFFLVGALVFVLRPGNRAAHALLIIGVAFFFNAWPGNYSVPTLFYPFPPASIPFDTWTAAINPSLIYLVLVFPQPKWPVTRFPRLTVTFLYLPWILVFNSLYVLHLNDSGGYIRAAFAIYPLQVILLVVVTVASLVHSAVTVRDPVERSQLKWLLLGIGGFVFVGVGGWLVTTYLLNGMELSWLVTVTGWFLLPICLAIGITRYRLFDIDLIIRRTLVYGSLTLTLALVYFGAVTILQTLFAAISGQQTSVATVISTLLIAGLFTPLRRRIQRDIDRRFFRQKYDAEKTLQAFAQSAREETDLDNLTTGLVRVVQLTFQPGHVSLWMRDGLEKTEP